jgi:hypothetical protein
MDAETLEALRGSIAKWEGIVAGTLPDMGIENCSLCQRFAHENCHGCPVMLRTGKSDCVSTPYMQWHTVCPWSEADIGDGEPVNERWAKTDAHRRAAQAELDFLKSLLPPEHRTDEQQLTSGSQS